MSKRDHNGDALPHVRARPRVPFQLRPARHIERHDMAAAAEAIERLIVAFDDILDRNSSGLTFTDLYMDGFNLVVAGFGKVLYENVQRHLAKGAAHYSGNADGRRRFKVYTIMLRDICMFMDRTYVVYGRFQSVVQLADDAWWARPNVWKRVAVRFRVAGRLAIFKRMWEEARFAPGMSGYNEGLADWVAHGGAE